MLYTFILFNFFEKNEMCCSAAFFVLQWAQKKKKSPCICNPHEVQYTITRSKLFLPAYSDLTNVTF